MYLFRAAHRGFMRGLELGKMDMAACLERFGGSVRGWASEDFSGCIQGLCGYV